MKELKYRVQETWASWLVLSISNLLYEEVDNKQITIDFDLESSNFPE